MHKHYKSVNLCVVDQPLQETILAPSNEEVLYCAPLNSNSSDMKI